MKQSFVMESNITTTDPSQQPLVSQNSPHFSKTFIILIVVIIIAVVGVGGYFVGANQNQVTQDQSYPTPPITQPSPTSIPAPFVLPTTDPSITADWKTYRNENYIFEIKYPQNWNVETTNNDSFIKLYNIVSEMQAKDAAKKIATEGTAFNNGLYIQVYETNRTLEDFIQSMYNNPDSPHGNTIKSTKNIEFPNSMRAIFVESNTGGYGLDSATFLKFKNYVFRFTKHYGGPFVLEKYTDQQFDQILSTFKFTGQNQIVSTSKTSPDGSFMITEETQGDSQKITVKKRDGSILVEDVISRNWDSITSNMQKLGLKGMGQIGIDFKGWTSNSHFVISIKAGSGDMYEVSIDTKTGSIEESTFEKTN